MHRVRNPKSMIITMQGNHSYTDQLKLIELLKNVPITCIVSVYINYKI